MTCLVNTHKWGGQSSNSQQAYISEKYEKMPIFYLVSSLFASELRQKTRELDKTRARVGKRGITPQFK